MRNNFTGIDNTGFERACKGSVRAFWQHGPQYLPCKTYDSRKESRDEKDYL